MGGLAALVDEIPAQVEVAPVLRDMVQAQERQFYLGMARVASQLAGFAAEAVHEVIGKTLRHAQQTIVSGSLEMNDPGLDEMTGAVKFVEVPEVFEAVPGPPGKDVAVDVAVRQLGAFK